jgi:hypothetical protein
MEGGPVTAIGMKQEIRFQTVFPQDRPTGGYAEEKELRSLSADPGECVVQGRAGGDEDWLQTSGKNKRFQIRGLRCKVSDAVAKPSKSEVARGDEGIVPLPGET